MSLQNQVWIVVNLSSYSFVNCWNFYFAIGFEITI